MLVRFVVFLWDAFEADGVVIWRFLCYQVDDSRVSEVLVLVGLCFELCETVRPCR